MGRTVDVFLKLLPAIEEVADVVFVRLPAHGTSPFAPTPSLEVLAARSREALETLLPARTTVLAGESLGGLIALAASPVAQRVVAIDPFLTTAKLWPVQRWRKDDERYAPFYRNIFGLTEAEVIDFDYRRLITDLACPAEVLAGSEPLLPPRATQRMPSLLDESDRALIRASRLATLTVVEGGHALLDTSPAECLAAIRRALQACSAALHR